MLRRLSSKVGHICHCSSINTQILTKRYECILRRMYPSPLWKEDEKPNLKRWEYVYILEDNTTLRPAGEMEVILTTDIEELGNEGEIVRVEKRLARNHLLPLGLGVYTSPENLAKYEEKRKLTESIKKQTKTGQRTKRQLEAMTLPIPMNPNVKWQLTKQHVRIAFRKVGVYLEDANIFLPTDPVTETGDIQLQVEINGVDKVTVNAVVFNYNKNQDYFPDIEVWKDTTIDIREHVAEAFKKLQNSKFAKHQQPQTSTGVES